MSEELPPMHPGGEWLQPSDNREPHYVVHEAHIKRLKSEGWLPASDPRKPGQKVTPPADQEKEDMKQRIAKLEALLAQVVEQKNSADVPAQDADSDAEELSASDEKPTRRTRK